MQNGSLSSGPWTRFILIPQAKIVCVTILSPIPDRVIQRCISILRRVLLALWIGHYIFVPVLLLSCPQWRSMLVCWLGRHCCKPAPILARYHRIDCPELSITHACVNRSIPLPEQLALHHSIQTLLGSMAHSIRMASSAFIYCCLTFINWIGSYRIIVSGLSGWILVHLCVIPLSFISGTHVPSGRCCAFATAVKDDATHLWNLLDAASVSLLVGRSWSVSMHLLCRVELPSAGITGFWRYDMLSCLKVGLIFIYLLILLILVAAVQDLAHVHLAWLVGSLLSLLLVLHQQFLNIDIFILTASARSTHLQFLGVDFLPMLLLPLPDIHVDLIDDDKHQLLWSQPVVCVFIYQNSVVFGPFTVNTIVNLLQR